MQQTSPYAICAEQVYKQYKNGVQALSGLSLTVKRGEIFTLLGQNGADHLFETRFRKGICSGPGP